jgi:hypothetical protein
MARFGSTYGKRRTAYRAFMGKHEEWRLLGDGRIIFKWISKK